MNKTLSTILIIAAVLALAGGVFFAGTMYARANGYGPSMMFGGGWNNSSTYGPGMMGFGRGGYGGMMGGHGRYNGVNSNVKPLTVEQAKVAAGKYLADLDHSDLQIAEIMIFDNNAYVVVKEAGTGIGAFELLVDPVSQIAYPEYGPNMMWNLKYSGLNHQYMMGGRDSYGMMGGWGDQNIPTGVSAEMPVTIDQAIQDAQAYLDAAIPGATAAADPVQFYGYYTLDFSKDGKVIGMLSVNGFTGQVFLHTWHGTFIEESEIQ